MHFILMSQRPLDRDLDNVIQVVALYTHEGAGTSVTSSIGLLEEAPQFICPVPVHKTIAKPYPRPDGSYEGRLTRHSIPPNVKPLGCVIAAFGFTT